MQLLTINLKSEHPSTNKCNYEAWDCSLILNTILLYTFMGGNVLLNGSDSIDSTE